MKRRLLLAAAAVAVAMPVVSFGQVNFSYQYEGGQAYRLVAEVGGMQAVGLHDAFWGPGIGFAGNFNPGGFGNAIPPFGPELVPYPPAFPEHYGGATFVPFELTGPIQPSVVQRWIDSPASNYGFALIPINRKQGPLDPANPADRPFFGNTQFVSTGPGGINDWGDKNRLRITFTDGTEDVLDGADWGYIRADVPDFLDPASFLVTPENGGPRPVLFRFDLARFAGRQVVSAEFRNGWFFSENGRIFVMYQIPRPWTRATVTYRNLVLDSLANNTWSGAASSDYFDRANWGNFVPNHRFAEAAFTGAGANPAVTIGSDVTLNKLIFSGGVNYTLSGAGEITMSKSWIINDRNMQEITPGPPFFGAPTPQAAFFNHDFPLVINSFGSHEINNNLTLAHTTVFLAFPDTVTTVNGRVFGLDFDAGFGDSRTQGIAVQNGGRVNLYGGYDAGPIEVEEVGGVYTSFLDIGMSGGVVSEQSEASLRAAVASWFAGGALGGNGIGSSLAGGPGRDGFATVAVRPASIDGIQEFGAFLGNVVLPDDMLFRYTYFGDVNLDGTLDAIDFNAVLNGFTNGLTGWANGDTNYDGVVDATDWLLFTQAYAYVLAGGLPFGDVGFAAQIPEPASLGVLGLAGLLTLRRKRR